MAQSKNDDGPTANRFPVIVIILVCIVVLVAAAIGYLHYDTNITHDKILDHVYVAGVDVGGMTPQQATDAVNRATKSTYSSKPMEFTIDRDVYTIDPQVSGATLDIEAAVTAAYNYGRSGFVIQKKIQQNNLKKGTVAINIIDYLNLDVDAIRTQAESIAPNYNTEVIQTTYRLEGEMPRDNNQQTGTRVLIIHLGRPGYSLSADSLYQQIIDGYNENRMVFTVECPITEPNSVDWDAVASENCVSPVDATLDTTTYHITDHVSGYGFTPDDVKKALAESAYDQEYTFEFHELAPTVTRESIEAELFKDVLGEYTATQSSSYARQTNLRLSCAAVNGTILLPGETFDYNKTVGERTPEAGYQPAASYAGMETVNTYGGGICQTSSTIYYSALMADLEIVSRTNHGFISSYVPYGMDATVSWGGPEFRFKNNTPYPIKIEAFADGGSVTVRILGTDYKDYYVKMEYEVWGVYSYKTEEKEFPPDNPNGYKNGSVITTPYTGYKICTYRCKYDKATNDLISREQEAISVYSARNKVVAKIVDPTPPATEPTTPPATAPSVSPDTEQDENTTP